MEQPSVVSNIKPYFQFPLKGERVAERFLIGCALLLAGFLLVPGLFVIGYGVQVMRRATAGDPPRMHAWQDWGALLSDGFRAWVISLVFFLPGAVVMLGGYAIYFASFLSLSGLSGNESDAVVLGPIMVGIASMFLGLSLGSLLSILASIFFPAALVHFAAEDRFTAAFHFRQWWRVLRSNALGFFITWVIVAGLAGVIYVVSMTAYFTLVLICFLPVLLLPAYFYLMLVGAALFGNAYAEGRGRARQPAT